MRTTPSLASYAYLLLPPDPSGAEVVEASPEWTVALPATSVDRVLWGRVPFRSPPGPARLARHVIGRERALRSLRAGVSSLRTKRVHRLAPPPGRPGAVGGRIRDALLSGALVELVRDNPPLSRLEEVVQRIGAELDWSSFAPGSDRAATARARLGDRPVILRLGAEGTPSDPRAAADALEILVAEGIERVPRVVARGEVSGVGYACESLLSGRRPRHVDEGLFEQVAEFLAGLPRAEAASGALNDDLAVLAELLPRSRADLERVAETLPPVLEGTPGVMTHGDLWAGNLFVIRKRLTGVIDWDGARRGGVPGTDLLHLAVSDRRQRAGGDIGAVWLERPWRSERFVRSTATYWRSFDLRPEPRVLDAIGAAWWAGWLRQALQRHERRLGDERWLGANVTVVLEQLRARL